MRLSDWLDTLDVHLNIVRYPNQADRWCATFCSGYGLNSPADFKDNPDDSILRGTHGNGKTPRDAVIDLICLVEGSHMVLDAHNEKHRRVYRVPKGLEY